MHLVVIAHLPQFEMILGGVPYVLQHNLSVRLLAIMTVVLSVQ